MSLDPGWYKDPADPTTQRWWDGEGWLGEPLPADQTPPPGPPPAGSTSPQVPAVPGPPGAAETPAPPPGGVPPSRSGPYDPAQGAGGAPPHDRVPPEPRTPPRARGLALITRGKVSERPHGYRLATIGARFTARLIDVAVVLALNVVVNGWFVYQYWLEISPVVDEAIRRRLAGEGMSDLPEVGDQAGYLQLVILLLAAALWFAYEVPSVANTGQTLGKRVMRIKVVAVEQDASISFGRSLRRWNPMGLPVLLWWCFGVGVLLQLIDFGFALFDRPGQQTLHDKSANTVVVSTTPPDDQRKETPDEPADPF